MRPCASTQHGEGASALLVTKATEFELKVHDAGKRESVGVVSSGRVDRQGDEVDQKSMREELAKFIKASGIVVWNHDWHSGGIGRVVEYDEKGDETLVRVRYGVGYKLANSMEVDDVWAQIEQGIVRTHSHAFTSDRQPKEGASGVFKCFVRDVFEVSVVTVPANADATFQAVKTYLLRTGQVVAPAWQTTAAGLQVPAPAGAGVPTPERSESEEAERDLVQLLKNARAALRGA